MVQATPQVKKIKDLRASGSSLREIAEKLKISRKVVEDALKQPEVKISKPKESKAAAPTSEKKVTKAKVTKGK